MRLRSIILFLFFGLGISYSQVVTTIPQYPTVNDSIVVFVDATQSGASEILNYTGTLYAHTGVTTNAGDWQHVIGNWGVNSSQPALTRLGANSYKLVIGYPRKFYNITSSEQIKSIDLVVRTADGSKQTRPDIFIPLYSSGINIVLNSPKLPTQFGDPLRAPLFVSQHDTLNLAFQNVLLNTKLSGFTIFDNGSQIFQSTKDSVVYPYIGADHQAGANMITAIGEDTAGNKDTLSFAIMVNSDVVKQNLPSGIEPGINYDKTNPTTATLALYAPYKKFVYVLGDFNDWKVSSAYYMKKQQITPDSVIWWLKLKNLSPGTEYAFQYLVDGQIRIADPYCEKVLDPNNDQYISSATYPNLKPYPQGKTNEIVSVLQTAQTPYNWHVKNFKKPDKTNLVIYELLVRDFVSTHDYKTLADTIGYFKRLGINAIELMPIMEFEGNESWGYNPDFDFAPDKYYGTKNDLKNFIDIAHQNGIAIILDAPMNDIFGSSPLARLYWDSANNRPAANNPWLNPIPRHPYNVGNDFNYESPAFQYYINRFTKFWIQNYHIDGYRFDLATGYTQKYSGTNVGLWQQTDPSRINNLERLADGIWKVDSSAYVILEIFSNGNEEKVLADYGMMAWDNMSGPYQQAAMGYSNPSWDISGISYKSWGWDVPGLVGYMESHDEERVMYKNLQYGNSSGNYNIKELGTALNRIKLCEAFLYTVPGAKMLWQFGELGYDVSIDFNGRIGNKPIRWNYYSDPQRLNLYKTTAALIKLKTEYSAFKSGNFTTDLAGNVKRITITDSSMDVDVLGNFDVVQRSINPHFQRTGDWYDYFSGDTLKVTDTQQLISLNPGQFYIYTTKKLPAPERGILSGVQTENPGVISNYQLSQNYPNPFNPTTVINYQIPKSGFVTLKVYDILGREVSTLVNENKSAGKYSVTFNGSKLSSGVYFYRLNSGAFSITKKFILMK